LDALGSVHAQTESTLGAPHADGRRAVSHVALAVVQSELLGSSGSFRAALEEAQKWTCFAHKEALPGRSRQDRDGCIGALDATPIFRALKMGKLELSLQSCAGQAGLLWTQRALKRTSSSDR